MKTTATNKKDEKPAKKQPAVPKKQLQPPNQLLKQLLLKLLLLQLKEK